MTQRWRLLVVCVALLFSLPGNPATAAPTAPPALARAKCGPGSLPETAIPGRVPAADHASGRAAKGYTCNARVVGHFGSSAGFKVLRYTDARGQVCAFYDTTRIFPTDLLSSGGKNAGVHVLDMRDPARPRQTAQLVTPAMLSPHESLLLNNRRGLLVAVMGNPGAAPGIVDVYDVSKDCLHPTLMSSTPMGLLGHESGFAPDGRTLYVSSGGGSTLTAVDLTNPRLPLPLAVTFGQQWHGVRTSADGRTLYATNMGLPGLDVYDVSGIQDRTLTAGFTRVTQFTWPHASIPQVAIPMTIRGTRYLLEVDEFAGYETDVIFEPGYHAEHAVGAARLINIHDVRRPRVVSDLRLAVHQPSARSGPQQDDPGALGAGGTELGGYAGHYCSIPRENDPGIVACSFLASGLRIFDIRDPRRPREVAYANKPTASGGAAFSQPAWDLKRKQVWYTDGQSGLWVLQLTNGVWPAGL